ncbi:MAG: TetR/AcrR family transcriptional regulator [Pseudomonadota bacterium]
MDLRAQNKEKRRQRILFEARRIIARDGFDALTTRGLAEAAGVTQPTLYNLIGSKDNLFRILMAESVARVWDRLKRFEGADPLETIEAVAIEPTALFAADEPYYRAAVIASDRMVGVLAAAPRAEEQPFTIAREAVRMATEATERAVVAGLLRGRVAAHVLGEQLYICFRGPLRDWAYGLISLETFQMRALRGFYMTLAIDAAAEFRALLEKKLFKLIEATPAAPSCAAS